MNYIQQCKQPSPKRSEITTQLSCIIRQEGKGVADINLFRRPMLPPQLSLQKGMREGPCEGGVHQTLFAQDIHRRGPQTIALFCGAFHTTDTGKQITVLMHSYICNLVPVRYNFHAVISPWTLCSLLGYLQLHSSHNRPHSRSVSNRE